MLRHYLVVVGVFLNVGAAAAAALIFVTLDRPFGQVVDRAANYFTYYQTGSAQKLGKLAIDLGLAHDWARQAGTVDEERSVNPLGSAANPTTQFPYQTYDASGKPRKLAVAPFSPPPNVRLVSVGSSAQLSAAIRRAIPGDVISLLPGRYTLSGQSVPVETPGSPNRPIYLRSTRLGDAVLEMSTVEGFHILAPFWVFENLEVIGVCRRDSRCEHAFHVVGQGGSFTLRNSILRDFNAPIKVNGSAKAGGARYPDNGLIEYNLIANSRARNTANPVTLVDINSANNWVVRGNFIADFAKSQGDHTSYGAFMKGGGSEGVFERNLVMCENRLAPDQGIRIGLSFGGGGIGDQFCRDGNCTSEHRNGIIRNNIILNCSRDVGIYINKGSNSQLFNNLLHNTLGIDVRFATSSATIENNIISGRIRERDGGLVRARNNLTDRHCLGQQRSNCQFDDLYAAADRADLRLKTLSDAIWGKSLWNQLVTDDFCGHRRTPPADLGPIQYAAGLSCLQP